MGRRRKRRYYFSEVEENALIEYIETDSREKRNEIYRDHLHKPLSKMVEIILRRYPIHMGNFAIEDVEMFGLSHLVEHMVKYNKNKITKSGAKTKAFSYCQTIVRNYFRDHGKTTYKEKKRILPIEDYSSEVENKIEYIYEMNHESDDDIENLINIVVDKIEERLEKDKSLKKNEIIVGQAIIRVLKSWDELFLEETPKGKVHGKTTNNFHKQKILLFLKEQTRLTTKEIRMSMKAYKEIYYFEKKSYFNDI